MSEIRTQTARPHQPKENGKEKRTQTPEIWFYSLDAAAMARCRPCWDSADGLFVRACCCTFFLSVFLLRLHSIRKKGEESIRELLRSESIVLLWWHRMGASSFLFCRRCCYCTVELPYYSVDDTTTTEKYFVFLFIWRHYRSIQKHIFHFEYISIISLYLFSYFHFWFISWKYIPICFWARTR